MGTTPTEQTAQVVEAIYNFTLDENNDTFTGALGISLERTQEIHEQLEFIIKEVKSTTKSTAEAWHKALAVAKNPTELVAITHYMTKFEDAPSFGQMENPLVAILAQMMSGSPEDEDNDNEGEGLGISTSF